MVQTPHSSVLLCLITVSVSVALKMFWGFSRDFALLPLLLLLLTDCFSSCILQTNINISATNAIKLKKNNILVRSILNCGLKKYTFKYQLKNKMHMMFW